MGKKIQAGPKEGEGAVEAGAQVHEAGKAGGLDLGATVAETVKGAVPPTESAITAAEDRRRVLEGAEAGEKGKGSGAGQAGKKRGPYKGSKAAPSGSRLETQTQDQKDAQFRAVGYEIADTLILAGMTLGGEDWKPVIQVDPNNKDVVVFNEQENLRKAWGDAAVKYQWGNVPAWLAVSLATAAYIGPRLAANSTKARISKFKLWLDSWKLKRQEKQAAKERAAADSARPVNA